MIILASLLPTLIFLAIVFLIFREVLTWYWKLNKIVELLERIDTNIREQVNFIQPGAGEEEKRKVIITKKLAN